MIIAPLYRCTDNYTQRRVLESLHFYTSQATDRDCDELYVHGFDSSLLDIFCANESQDIAIRALQCLSNILVKSRGIERSIFTDVASVQTGLRGQGPR